MSRQTTFATTLGAVVVLVLVTVLFLVTRDGEQAPAERAAEAQENGTEVMRDDSHVLGSRADTGVTFVEFLDFECEACGAAYPIVEELREKYEGRVTFVARYFPLPSHFNAERAARSVESAARQGEFEAMYSMMYATQRSWGEAQTPKDDLFRTFAEEIGLDLEQYDADYASEDVAQRVQSDLDDGAALGLQGTPSFFINGEPFEPQTVQDFNDALDQALAE